MKIEKVAVIGAGTMGHSLALVHALEGCSVRLQDIDGQVLAASADLIDAACATLVESGAVDAETADAAVHRILPVAGLPDAVGDADLVVEAVVEKPEVKRDVFSDIHAHAPEAAVIASNTSYLDVFPLVPDERQARTLIAHWYTPPYIVDLVDIAPGPRTLPEIVAAVRDLYAGFGKQPLVFDRLIPGYIANRLQSAMNLECFRMIDEGWVTPEDIDFSIHHGLVLRLAVLGHMKKADYTDLRMTQNALANRMYTPPEVTGESETVSRLVAEGRTGVRAGAGLYDYGDASPEKLFKDRDLKLLRLKAELKTLLNEDGKMNGKADDKD